MAHDIANINGQDCFFGSEAAWHGLGQVVNGARSWSEVIDLAGLNWTVEKQRLFDERGKEIDYFGIFRDGLHFLGAVGANYTPIQNADAFAFVDALLSVENGAHYESAGALGKGERLWTLARIPHDFEVVSGDAHKTYLLFSTSHDGSLAATAKITSVRVVCNNTLNQALALNGSFARVKHTADAQNKLERARLMMGNAVKNVSDLREKPALSSRMLDKETYLSCIDRLFPPSLEADGTAKQSTRRDNIVLAFSRLFESNDKDAFPSIRGTAYNLLNAVTEYTDHFRSTRIAVDRPKSREMELVTVSRKESALFGTGADFKARALEVITDATKECKAKSAPVIVDIAPSPKTTAQPEPPKDAQSAKHVRKIIAVSPTLKIYAQEYPEGLKLVSITADKTTEGKNVYPALSDCIAKVREHWANVADLTFPETQWEVIGG